MREFRLRTDLKRVVIDGFALPLGVESTSLPAPTPGYTISFTNGEGDEPDMYAFHVVVSHERIRPIIRRAFDLLPDEVIPIVEIGSRDAYRSLDVYVGREPVPVDEFLSVWNQFEFVLLEDSSMGVGANSEEPFVEVFLDSWKGLSLHVPVDLREETEAMLQGFGLEEVPETWPGEEEEEDSPETQMREVLEIVDDQSPDLDELLLQLREAWGLELNIDPDSNVDEGGRELGLTLWHAIVLADSIADPARGAYISVWATASSLGEMESLIADALDPYGREWKFSSVYSIDRVAYDERPEELRDLAPRFTRTRVHLVQVDPWGEPPPERGPERRRGGRQE